MANLPSGTVTFLFTDIEGSTALWEREPAAMPQAAARHDMLIEQAVTEQGGVVVRPRGEGDSRFAVFARASDAVAAALALQWDLAAEPWPTSTPLRVRVALHTGEAELRDGDYYGTAVNRCARLRAVAHGGQVLLSQATADLVQDTLPSGASLQDLGAHRLRDLVRADHIYQLVQPGVPATFPPLRSLDTLPNNLPLQLTSFVGREADLAEVTRLLPTTRLLTLTGAGGCGKTRLALQVAAELVDQYPDGVWFVDLAPLTDPALVPQAVASALEVHEQPGQPVLTTLVGWLRSRQLLLVVDNCEHVLDSSARLTEALVRVSPGLCVLATSRELLGVSGEVAWRVPSLATPDPAHLPAADQVLAFAAVRLFAERARQVQPAFAVTARTAPAVAQICRRLDGIPLALELAAARATALSAEQIAARLDDRFRLLTGGRRTALRRQQTLAAAIDWSHDLLTEPERVLFRRLAVFAGGFTLEAAEAVGVGDGIEPADVVDLLTRLVEKSLVQAEADEGRYRLLETVRQYAQDKLVHAGEAVRMRDRHRDTFLALAEVAEPGLWGPDQLVWLDRLDTEHDNLRAALAWCLETAPAAGLQLATSLYKYWRVRGHIAESRRWLTDLLALAPTPTAARAKALVMAGMTVREQGETAASQHLFAESLAIAQGIGDVAGQAYALNELAYVVSFLGDPARAEVLLNEGLVLARAAGDGRRARSLMNALGTVVRERGDYDRARTLLAETVTLDRQAGDAYSAALSLVKLGEAAWQQGDAVAAGAALQESLALYQALGDRYFVSWPMMLLGLVAQLAGDEAGARAWLDEALAAVRAAGGGTLVETQALWGRGQLAAARGEYGPAAVAFCESLGYARAGGRPYGMIWNVEGLARVAAGRGRADRAARLLGAAAAARQRTGPPLSPVERPSWEAALEATRAALGEDRFARVWAEGQTLTLEAAVAEALAEGGGDG